MKFNGDHNHYYEKIGNNRTDITDEITFEVPKNWIASSLGSVIVLTSGCDLESNKYSSDNIGVPYITGASNIVDGKIIINRYTSRNYINSHKGDILFTCKGTIGKIALNTIGDVHIARQIMGVKSFIDTNFTMLFLQYISQTIMSMGKSIIPGIERKDILLHLIFIPPLAEQQRIVEKIELLFAEIDKIENAQNELDKLKEQTRKKVLDLAVRGKLVKQDPNDEPASVLLEKIEKEKKQLIKEGKIKRDKNESIIYRGDDKNYYEKIGNSKTDITDEIPFEIPESWDFARQGVICWLDNGTKSSGKVLPYLEAKTLRGVKDPEMISTGVLVHKGDKVILVDGENSGEVMNVPYDGYMGSTFRILKTTNYISYDYLSLFFELNKNLYRNNKKGTAIPHLNKEIFHDLLFPLPPFAEQERIATMVKQIDMI